MARLRGFPQGRPRSKRQTLWGIGPGSEDVTSFSATGSAILGLGVQTGQANTITRTRGYLQALIASAGSVGDGFTGAFGIGLVSLPAFTAGIVSMPTPVTEVDWDGWLWHQFFSVHTLNSTPFGDSASYETDVDSKAMRKFTDEIVMFAAVEVTEIGVATLDVFFDSRVLLKMG